MRSTPAGMARCGADTLGDGGGCSCCSPSPCSAPALPAGCAPSATLPASDVGSEVSATSCCRCSPSPASSVVWLRLCLHTSHKRVKVAVTSLHCLLATWGPR